MDREPSRILPVSASRNHDPDIATTIWDRVWTTPIDSYESLRSSLALARTYSGLGLRSPFAIHLGPRSITTRTLARGATLEELLSRHRVARSESLARAAAEQILFGLERIHQGLGQPHGALTPEFVGRDYDNNFFLWSTPSAWTEHIHSAEEKFRSYRPMEIAAAKPCVESDMYAVGRIMMDLAPNDQRVECETGLKSAWDPPRDRESNDFVGIVVNSQRVLPSHRYRRASEMAQAINPETELINLNITDGKSLLREGLKQYHLSQYEKAEELWQDALRNDWLSVAIWNNLGVSRMRRQEWGKALEDLRKAHTLDISHPVVTANMALCQVWLKNLSEADRWGRQTVAMRPDYVPGLIVLSNLALRERNYELALHHATTAICRAPYNRTARWQYIRILEKTGREDEAALKREELMNLEYRVPFAECLIDDLREPPWGKLRAPREDTGEWYIPDDNPDPGPDSTGCGVPRKPISPGPSANSSIPRQERQRGFLRK